MTRRTSSHSLNSKPINIDIEDLKKRFEDRYWLGEVVEYFDRSGLSFEDFWYYFGDDIIEKTEELELE